MTAIRPITRKFLIRNFLNFTQGHFCGNDFYYINHSNFWDLFYDLSKKNRDLGPIFGISAKGHFCGFVFYNFSITRKFMK